MSKMADLAAISEQCVNDIEAYLLTVAWLTEEGKTVVRGAIAPIINAAVLDAAARARRPR